MKHIKEYEKFVNETKLNEAKLKDNSYQSVLFGKSAKSGKWTIIRSTDPNKPSLQTKEDLYPRRSEYQKYSSFCIIQDLGGNRGQTLQQDAEEHLKQLNSGEINYDTARERFSKVEFI